MNQEVLNWVKKASEDLKVAEHEMNLESDDIITSAVCFHCQQAIEKFLKAFLTSKNIRAGKTHDLAYLMEQCIKSDSDFEKLDREEIEKITFYAIEVRYPEDFYIPSLEEARECMGIARILQDFVLRKLGFDGKI